MSATGGAIVAVTTERVGWVCPRCGAPQGRRLGHGEAWYQCARCDYVLPPANKRAAVREWRRLTRADGRRRRRAATWTEDDEARFWALEDEVARLAVTRTLALEKQGGQIAAIHTPETLSPRRGGTRPNAEPSPPVPVPRRGRG